MFFVPRPPDPPWGDYGHILTHGMTTRLPRAGDRLQLERTGPFIPPITFPGPGDIVVTDHLRKALVAARFVGIGFRPVVKARIVRLDWHRWSTAADEPRMYPRTGDPEGYVLERRQASVTSRAMGRLWELVPTTVRGALMARGRIVLSKQPRADLCRPRGRLESFVSGRLRDWLSIEVGDWVRFEPAKMRVASPRLR